MENESKDRKSEHEWSESRIRQTLLRNPTVDGCEEIANLLIVKGRLGVFEAGSELISAGPSTDEVYFLLSGTATVSLADGRTTIRSAPTQVGEMAVLDRGSDRSASVRAGQGGVVTWVLSGDYLVEVFAHHPGARERMRSEMAGRHRELASRVQQKSGPGPMTWMLLSILAALIVSLAAWSLATFAGGSVLARVIVTGAAALVTYVLVQGRNPAFFWRRMFAVLVVFAMAALGMQRSITLNADGGGQTLKFELNSSGLTVGEGTLWALIAAWFFAVGICAYFEYRRQSTN